MIRSCTDDRRDAMSCVGLSELKEDVVRRGCTPAPYRVTALMTKAHAIQMAITRAQDTLAAVEVPWKQVWERELKRIVAEQQVYRESQDVSEEVAEGHGELLDTLSSLQQVTAMRQLRTPTPRVFERPMAGAGFDGLGSVMQEIESMGIRVPASHEAPGEEDGGLGTTSARRLAAIEASEARRVRERAERRWMLEQGVPGDGESCEEDFEIELRCFVRDRKLNGVGGIEDVERMRAEKDKLLLRSLFS